MDFTKQQEIDALRKLARKYAGGYLGGFLSAQALDWFETEVRDDVTPNLFGAMMDYRDRALKLQGWLQEKERELRKQIEALEGFQHELRNNLRTAESELDSCRQAAADERENLLQDVQAVQAENDDLRRAIQRLEARVLELTKEAKWIADN